MADLSSSADMTDGQANSHDPLSDSLEQLLASRQSHQDDITDASCCCGEDTCQNQKRYEERLQKAESDARLAAGIPNYSIWKTESQKRSTDNVCHGLMHPI
jgi:hypothetical protein